MPASSPRADEGGGPPAPAPSRKDPCTDQAIPLETRGNCSAGSRIVPLALREADRETDVRGEENLPHEGRPRSGSIPAGPRARGAAPADGSRRRAAGPLFIEGGEEEQRLLDACLKGFVLQTGPAVLEALHERVEETGPASESRSRSYFAVGSGFRGALRGFHPHLSWTGCFSLVVKSILYRSLTRQAGRFQMSPRVGRRQRRLAVALIDVGTETGGGFHT